MLCIVYVKDLLTGMRLMGESKEKEKEIVKDLSDRD